MEQSSVLSAKYDCPVARQNVSPLATVHDYESGYNCQLGQHKICSLRVTKAKRTRKSMQVDASLQNQNLAKLRIRKCRELFHAYTVDLRSPAVHLRWVVKRGKACVDLRTNLSSTKVNASGGECFELCRHARRSSQREVSAAFHATSTCCFLKYQLEYQKGVRSRCRSKK